MGESSSVQELLDRARALAATAARHAIDADRR